MALLLRARQTPPAMSPERLVERVGDLAGEVRERADEAAEGARERAGEVADELRERAGEVAEELRERAGEVAEEVRERAGEVAEPLLARVVVIVGQIVRLLGRVVAIASKVGLNILQALARGMVKLADQSADLADIEPPATVRRHGRRRSVLWFTGGFVAGAATGYAVSELRSADHDRGHEHGRDLGMDDHDVGARWPVAGEVSSLPGGG